MMAPSMASDFSVNDERSPLLANPIDPKRVVVDDNSSLSLRDESQGCEVPRRVVNRLYLSDFLSTWELSSLRIWRRAIPSLYLPRTFCG